MRHPFALSSLSLPVALAVAGSAWLARPQDPAPGAAEAARVAVVDIAAVLHAYPGAKAKEASFRTEEERWNGELKQLQADLQEAESFRDALERGSEEYERADLDVMLKQAKFEKTKEVFKSAASLTVARIELELYEEVSAAIAAFADANGYDVVLRWRGIDDGKPLAAKVSTYHERDVLFRSEAADITEQVVKFIKSWSGSSR